QTVVDPPRRLHPGAPGYSGRDLVQPATHRRVLADGPGLANEHQEGGLKSVLGFVAVIEQTPAHAQDQGGVTPDQQLEGGSSCRRTKASSSCASVTSSDCSPLTVWRKCWRTLCSGQSGME